MLGLPPIIIVSLDNLPRTGPMYPLLVEKDCHSPDPGGANWKKCVLFLNPASVTITPKDAFIHPNPAAQWGMVLTAGNHWKVSVAASKTAV